jgi:4-diphosphocytidyl-2-C-methyl-D-erythritol kinase
MQTVDLCDEITVTIGCQHRQCRCDVGYVPQDERNLAYRAAALYLEHCGKGQDGFDISIRKKIPMQGGMAGGSADAAAVLRAMNALYQNAVTVDKLMEMALSLGSDVPFCLMGGTALAEGRGEVLSKLPDMPQCFIVLIKPEFSVSTPRLFAELDRGVISAHPRTDDAISALGKGDLPGLCVCMENVFEPVLAEEYPEIQALRNELLSLGALSARLTGTGSVVFGVFDSFEKAEAAYKAFHSKNMETFLTKPV